jgi:hypothetical protein
LFVSGPKRYFSRAIKAGIGLILSKMIKLQAETDIDEIELILWTVSAILIKSGDRTPQDKAQPVFSKLFYFFRVIFEVSRRDIVSLLENFRLFN